jgi:hypothetical protein
MRSITIGKKRQYTFTVDDEDYEYVMAYRWTYKISAPRYKSKPYIRRNIRVNGSVKGIYLHDEILSRMGLSKPPKTTADHKDRETLNNTRENLRYLNKRGQNINRITTTWVERFNASQQANI